MSVTPPVDVRAAASGPIATLQDVSKRFGKRTALERFSLQLRGGEVTALLGPLSRRV